MKKPAKLFSPGPTPLSKGVLEALALPPLHHRSTAFKKIIQESLENLKVLFDEPHRLVFTSTGTGALEASVLNFISKEDFVISLDGGKFGERWGEILAAYQIKNSVYKFNWGDEPNLEQVTQLLKEHKPHALCMQACETSTGTSYQVGKIAELIQMESPQTLLIVDGVTAVGAYPLSMKENKIDVLITGSQKALGLPVGLSFLACSDKALKKNKTANLPRYYFDVQKELKNLKQNTTWFSSPTQLWQSLHIELQKLKGLGLEQKFQTCKELQKTVHEWAQKENLKLFSKNPSLSLTALILPEKIKASDLQKRMIELGFYFATGQGAYKEKLIRIGHMANITKDEMLSFLSVLSKTLKEFRD